MVRWLQAAASFFSLIYPVVGTITVTGKGLKETATEDDAPAAA